MGKGKLFAGIGLLGVAGWILLKSNSEDSEGVDLGGGFSGGGGDYGLMPTGYEEPEGAYDNTSSFPTGIVDEFMAQAPVENPFLGMTEESNNNYSQPTTKKEVETYRKAGTPYNTIIDGVTYGYGMASEDSFQIVDSPSKKVSKTQASADLTRGILAQKDSSYVTLKDGSKYDPMGSALSNPSVLKKPEEEKFNIFGNIGSFFGSLGSMPTKSTKTVSQPLGSSKKSVSTRTASSSKSKSSGASSSGSYSTSSGGSVSTTGKHFFSGRRSSSSSKKKKKSRARRRIG